MGAISSFLKGDLAFDPATVQTMSAAFDAICTVLNIPATAIVPREVIAMRVIDLAQHGENDAEKLRDRVLRESQAGSSGL
jgi:hypothetical protein